MCADREASTSGKSGKVTAQDEWRGCGVKLENPPKPLRWYSPDYFQPKMTLKLNRHLNSDLLSSGTVTPHLLKTS